MGDDSKQERLVLIFCRICKENYGEFLTLDSKVCPKSWLVDIFNECTQLGAKIGDPLPQIVCQKCVEELKNIVLFIRKAKSSDIEFKEMVKKKVDKEIEDLTWELEELETVVEELDSCEETEEIQHMKEENNKKERLPGSPDLDVAEPEKEIMDILEPYLGPENNTESDEDTESHMEASHLNSYSPPFENCKPKNSQINTEIRPKKKNFKCSNCDKCFSTNQKLQQHNLAHSKAKDYVCPLCGKEFATIYRQRDHLKMHENERNYSCKTCEKSFNKYYHLKLHMETHNSSRPFVCHVCGKSFQLRSVLKTHMTLHEGKKINCPDCHRKFSRLSHLNIHKRIHSGFRPYKCSDCGKSYVQKSHLDRHMGLHLGIRFNCEHCHKVYTKKTSLDTHLREEHLRNKIYTCRICSMVFEKQKGYYYHMKKKHQEEQKTDPLTQES